jgi:ABC-type enterochelin transport system permease subunit
MNPLRVILWTVAMAYCGFLITGRAVQSFNSTSISGALMGALLGFLLAVMFTLRHARKAPRARFAKQ